MNIQVEYEIEESDIYEYPTVAYMMLAIGEIVERNPGCLIRFKIRVPEDPEEK